MASVAGNFLQEKENSNITDNAVSGKDPLDFVGINVEDKQEEEAGLVKGDLFEHGSCTENASCFVPGLPGKHNDQRYMLNGYIFSNENFSSKISFFSLRSILLY